MLIPLSSPTLILFPTLPISVEAEEERADYPHRGEVSFAKYPRVHRFRRNVNAQTFGGGAGGWRVLRGSPPPFSGYLWRDWRDRFLGQSVY